MLLCFVEITEKINIENIKKCPRYDYCSIPVCPLDFWVSEKTELPGEEKCPLLIQRRTEKEKAEGIKVSIRGGCVFNVWRTNVKMLNTRNLKRWDTHHKI